MRQNNKNNFKGGAVVAVPVYQQEDDSFGVWAAKYAATGALFDINTFDREAFSSWTFFVFSSFAFLFATICEGASKGAGFDGAFENSGGTVSSRWLTAD